MSEYRQSGNAPLIVAGTKVVALDQRTGQTVWSYEGISQRANRIRITDDRVFVLDFEANMHCLRLSDGAVVGVVSIGGDEATMLPVGDRLYVFAGDKVTALDDSGKILWRRDVGFDGVWSLVGLGVPGNEIQPDFSRS